MPPASRVGGSDTSTRSRATATVTRPDSCCTRNGTVSLASNTTRASSPDTKVLTRTLGIETGPMTRTRWATRHSTGLSRNGPRSRGRPSTGTSQRPPSSETGDERSFRSPSTEARLFLWCSTSSWLPRRTLTAPPGASLVSVAPRPASTSSIATRSPSARSTVATSRRCVAVRTVIDPPAAGASAGARARRPTRARRRESGVTRRSKPFNEGSLRALRSPPQDAARSGASRPPLPPISSMDEDGAA